ncbi:MAG: 23S rRNA (uracil(1939)-C(5))-methyltransferase RlmD [Bacteroidales bacterium]|nr:23S rRNA (uracil(1939)-C(5))-methyltransferase RlmD [Bacteroidales bacterium]MCF8389457.1 23S rRNA (uracil(1939)-C(5))-methyltransferase RlmD [Bacteroidales bacterium]
MRRKKLPFFENIEITDLGAEGNAIARVNEMVIFVKMVAPGDVVDLQIVKKRKNYMEGRVMAIHKYSDIRTEPFCKHFGTCGGCKLQHIPYNLQIKYKQKQVEDALTRIGHLELPVVRPIMGSDHEQFYRNKLEFSFSNQRWITEEEARTGVELEEMRALGFHVPGYFDKIVDVEKCWLQDDPSNQIRNSIKAFCLKNNYDFFNTRDHSGFMRNLIVRTSTTGEVMVIVVFNKESKAKREALLTHLMEAVPGISSLFYVINSKLNDSLYDQEMVLFAGKGHIIEKLEDLSFKIDPKSFFQTNSTQALRLYQVAREFADLKGDEVVYDLYTGTGSIANFVARKAKKVVGIESVPEAIEDAKINSEINNINNTEFFAGDMKDIFTDEFVETNGRPDLIITDPPRAGMHSKVVEQILKLEPARIVYVSCNPATQARDLQLLDAKYKLVEVQPVDMFPHTHHVENVVKLEIRR